MDVTDADESHENHLGELESEERLLVSHFATTPSADPVNNEILSYVEQIVVTID